MPLPGNVRLGAICPPCGVSMSTGPVLERGHPSPRKPLPLAQSSTTTTSSFQLDGVVPSYPLSNDTPERPPRIGPSLIDSTDRHERNYSERQRR